MKLFKNLFCAPANAFVDDRKDKNIKNSCYKIQNTVKRSAWGPHQKSIRVKNAVKNYKNTKPASKNPSWAGCNG